MKIAFVTALIGLYAFGLVAATPSAEQVLAEAKTKAASEKKAIFLHFGASWCIWCKRLETWMDKPDVKRAFDKYFLPVKLVVRENADNKNLENQGGDKVLDRLGGTGAGIPFMAFLDRDGKLIVNSMRPSGNGRSENIGYPGGPEEAAWFMSMIRKAAPQISPEDLKVIETSLKTPVK